MEIEIDNDNAAYLVALGENADVNALVTADKEGRIVILSPEVAERLSLYAIRTETTMEEAVNAALDQYLTTNRLSVLAPWVETLPLMQQSVLLALVRNEDGIDRDAPQKQLIKWFRRCILLSAFDRRVLTSPYESGGGSFTGSITDVTDAVTDFVRARDSMKLHYFAHAMHAFEILGYKHPDPQTRGFWYDAYVRMCDALHMRIETVDMMDRRLCDNEALWQEREVPGEQGKLFPGIV